MSSPVYTRLESARWLRLIDDGDETPSAVQSAVRAVDHLIRCRRIRAVRIGRENFIAAHELESFLRRETDAQPVNTRTEAEEL